MGPLTDLLNSEHFQYSLQDIGNFALWEMKRRKEQIEKDTIYSNR